MSFRDIIEATRPCPTCGSAYYEEYGSTREHLLLMEAVIEAVTPTREHYSGEVMGMSGHYEVGYTGTECPVCGSVDYGLGTQHKDGCPLPALIAFRAERGLS